MMIVATPDGKKKKHKHTHTHSQMNSTISPQASGKKKKKTANKWKRQSMLSPEPKDIISREKAFYTTNATELSTIHPSHSGPNTLRYNVPHA